MKQPSKGVSFVLILLATAVVGISVGTWLGSVGPDIEEPEEVVARIMPKAFNARPMADMSPDPASLSGIPPYPGVYPRRMIRNATAQSGPMSVAWFQTDDQAQDVLMFYEKAFAAEGRRVFSAMRTPQMGYVAWLDAQYDAGLAAGVLHMVTAMKQFDHTVVLISASRPDMAMNSNVELPFGMALPPNAVAPQVVDMGVESPEQNKVVYARVPGGKPEGIVAFFEKNLGDQGYTLSGKTFEGADGTLVAAKGPLEVTIGVRDEGDFSSVVLTYNQELRRVTP